MCDDRSKDEDTETRERNDEHVKVPVVSFSHAVSNPGTVMIKSFCFVKDRDERRNLSKYFRLVIAFKVKILIYDFFVR